MATEPNVSILKRKIEEKLFNYSPNSLSDEMKKFEFEQYKLIVDSAHKIDERRNGSNNIFIAINSIFSTILTQIVPYPNLNIEKLEAVSKILFCFNTALGLVPRCSCTLLYTALSEQVPPCLKTK